MSTYLWVAISFASLGAGVTYWLNNLSISRRLSQSDKQYKLICDQYRTLQGDFSQQKNAYDTLKQHSIARVKELKTNVFKITHRYELAQQYTQKLKNQNTEISKKITQLFKLKQNQIVQLEDELKVLKSQSFVASTSTEQVEVLKDTVTRLESILIEEADDTDKHLTVLENRLLRYEPIIDVLPDQKYYEDDLTKIVGIGPKLANILREYGVISFRQLAKMTENEISDVGKMLGEFGDRIIRDRWVEQAKELDKFRN